MSARKAKRQPRRKPKVRRAGSRLSRDDIETMRLALLGVVATCELVRASYAASRCTGVVLTRGVLQPLREVLTQLGERDPEFSMAENRRPHVSANRRA